MCAGLYGHPVYVIINLWQQHEEIGNLEMFPLTQKQQNANAAVLRKISEHLKTLEDKLSFYFCQLARNILIR